MCNLLNFVVRPPFASHSRLAYPVDHVAQLYVFVEGAPRAVFFQRERVVFPMVRVGVGARVQGVLRGRNKRLR